jgi:hypothetical protein
MPELKTPQNETVLIGHLSMLPMAVMALGTGLCRFPAQVLDAGL